MAFDHTRLYWMDTQALYTSDALEHYQGDFMDDIMIEEAPEIDHWLQVERERHRLQHNVAEGAAAGGLDTAAQMVSVVMASVVMLADPYAILLSRCMIRAQTYPIVVRSSCMHERFSSEYGISKVLVWRLCGGNDA